MKKTWLIVFSIVQCLLLAPTFAAENENNIPTIINIGDFSHVDLQNWTEKVFAGQNTYALVKDPTLKRTVLKAVSHQSASPTTH